MSVVLRLRCDRCGRASDPVEFDGAQPRMKIEDLRQGSGWRHRFSRADRPAQDLCPECARRARS